MIRISLPFLFEISSQLEPLATLPDGDTAFKDVWFELMVAKGAVEGLTTGSVFSPYLIVSYNLGTQLLQSLNAVTSNGLDYTITHFQMWEIKKGYSSYKIALLAEMGSFGSYFVTRKGAYDTSVLLQFGETLFPPDLGSKVPEAIVDAREAGKCLAFEVPTACGFHTFRVAESVLRRYYAHVTGGAAAPKVRNIGVYVKALEQSGKADAKILMAVKQMANLHRNPLIHPEAVLTIEEAIATYGIARSAISAMLAVIPEHLPTTAIPSASP